MRHVNQQSTLGAYAEPIWNAPGIDGEFNTVGGRRQTKEEGRGREGWTTGEEL